MENKSFAFEPNYAVHPGEYIEEMLEQYGMRQAELAIRLGITTKHMSNMINGKAPVTIETAQSLEKVFSNPARYWLLLQANYDALWHRNEEKHWYAQHQKECENWLEQFDYTCLEKQGYLIETQKAGSAAERVDKLLQYFGCADMDCWNNLYCGELPASCRITGADKVKIGTAAAWLRKGQMVALEYLERLSTYSRVRFKNTLKQLEQFNRYSEFEKEAIVLCKQAGVCLLLMSAVPAENLSGAAFWLKGGRTPCIQLNNADKDAGRLRLALYQEARHILHDSKKYMFIDCREE